MQPYAEIIVDRDDECATTLADIVGEPEPMRPIRIIEKKVASVLRFGARKDRSDPFMMDLSRAGKSFRCCGNDDRGG